MRRAVPWVVVLVVACGGSTSSLPDAGGGDGSAGSSSGGGSGGSSGSSSGSSSGGSSTSGSGSSGCDALLAQVDAARTGARQCCPACNHLPCAYTVDDLCCPLTVDAQGSAGVAAFESALAAFRSAGCTVACPAIACRVGPSGSCDPTTSLCAE